MSGRRGQGEAATSAQTGQLLRRIRRLELTARANVAGLQRGDYSSTVRGQGMIFHELRRYVDGEPARRIDWNVTARLGEPYVKVSRQERRRDVFVALDTSPSMQTGFHSRLKIEVAVEVAATLALAALDGGDRLATVFFADRVLSQRPPRAGGRRLFETLRDLLNHAAPWRRPVAVSDPRSAVHAIQQHRGRRFVIFLISDFIDHDVPEDLKYLQARHDVSLLHIWDPVEQAVAAPIRFAGFSPEGRRAGARKTRPLTLPLALPLAPRRGTSPPGAEASTAQPGEALRRQAGRHAITVESISTADPVALTLGRFFHRKRRRAS